MSPYTLRAVPPSPYTTDSRPGQGLCNLATCRLAGATHTFKKVTELQAVQPRDLAAQDPYYSGERTQREEVTHGDVPPLPQPCVHGHPHGWVKSSQVLLLYLTREPYLRDCLIRIPCIITHLKSLIVQMTGNSEEDPGQRGFS